MQDMGAAGIICSTSEMSAKGGVGMRIDLDKVPTRQKDMKAWELLLSESQERMLLVAEKGREKEVTRIFAKWDLPCSVIGEVTADGLLDFYMHGELQASLPAEELVLGGGAPQYDREYREPAYLEKIRVFDQSSVRVPKDLKQVAQQLIALPSIASKRWIFTQYDSMVGTVNSSTNEPSDAAVVLVKGTRKAIAVTTDCNSRYVYADPYKGAMIAVSEAARNIVCSGGEPLGVTNCLNFGNPYDPEVYYQFVEVIRGMGEACRKFNTPVTGGNVSFYNQNPDGPVNPTPTIGMVGLLADIADKMTMDFKEENDLIYLVGEVTDDMGSSEYLHNLCGVEYSAAPRFDLDEEFLLQKRLAELIAAKCIRSAHDVSEGGLFTALCESGFPNELGFSIQSAEGIRKDAFLFGEGQSRVIVTVSPGNLQAFRAILHDLPYVHLGVVTPGELMIDGVFWGSVSTWKYKYDTAIESYLAGEEAGSALIPV
jgi:phosphoribosylformylglycinamidine synthase subunit PurL